MVTRFFLLLRLLSVVLVGTLSQGCSCTGAYLVQYSPTYPGPLFEREEIIFYVDGTSPMVEYLDGGRKPWALAGHLDAIFVVMNGRDDTVVISTASGMLLAGSQKVPNTIPQTITLDPRESKEIWLRFDLGGWDVQTPERSSRLVLCDVTLPDKRNVSIEVDLGLSMIRGERIRRTPIRGPTPPSLID